MTGVIALENSVCCLPGIPMLIFGLIYVTSCLQLQDENLMFTFFMGSASVSALCPLWGFVPGATFIKALKVKK